MDLLIVMDMVCIVRRRPFGPMIIISDLPDLPPWDKGGPQKVNPMAEHSDTDVEPGRRSVIYLKCIKVASNLEEDVNTELEVRVFIFLKNNACDHIAHCWSMKRGEISLLKVGLNS